MGVQKINPPLRGRDNNLLLRVNYLKFGNFLIFRYFLLLQNLQGLNMKLPEETPLSCNKDAVPHYYKGFYLVSEFLVKSNFL